MRRTRSLNELPNAGPLRIVASIPYIAVPGMATVLRSRMESHLNLQESKGNTVTKDSVTNVEDNTVTLPLALATIVAMLGGIQYGYNIGVLNVPADSIKANLNSDGTAVSDSEWSWVVSIFCLGGVMGSYIGGYLADKWGRKRYLAFNILVFLIASLLEFFSTSVAILIPARFIVGFGSGGATVVLPLYLGEIAPASLRGALGTLTQFATVIGILVANILGKPLESDPEWRYLLGATIIAGGLQLAGLPFLLESPRWLMHKGRVSEAERNLRKFRGRQNVEIDLVLMGEVDDAEQEDDQNKNSPTLALLKDRSMRQSLFIGIALQLAQQFSGINAVFYYSSTFFKKAGIQDDYTGTCLAGAVNVIATGAAIPMMDRLGRRLLLLLSSAGMSCSCVLLTIALFLADNSSLDAATLGYCAVVAIMLFVIFFEIGLGPIPWLIVAEIFPPEHRGAAMGLCSGINWMSNFVVGMTFTWLNNNLKDAVFIPFGIVLFMAFFFTLKYVPETKGRSLEDIQDELTGRKKQDKNPDSDDIRKPLNADFAQQVDYSADFEAPI